jgi:trehalose/maltose hydrolase-like predicted phosphorylase
VEILAYRQELDLRRGVLLRTIRFEDGHGRRSSLTERRFVSMADMHLGALDLALAAENWSARVTVRSGIDGRVVNAGALLYRPFNNRHLEPLSGEVVGPDGVHLLVRTSQSHLHVAQVARTRAFRGGELIVAPRRVIEQPGYIGQEFSVQLDQGETLVLEKLASLYTSRDQAISPSPGNGPRSLLGPLGARVRGAVPRRLRQPARTRLRRRDSSRTPAG